MNEFRADLHCHTNCSDGSATPEEIVKLAFIKGLTGLSITDHDTVEAYKTAAPLAKQINLALIPGVEFSAVQRETSVHILAYSFRTNSPIIQELCTRHSERREKRNSQILCLLGAVGMPVSEGEIHSHTDSLPHVIGRPHIARAMVKKGYVSSIQEAFQKYIGEGKSCYAPGISPTVEETLDIIHRANGLAVIAHPHLIKSNKIIHELLAMDFDGIEGYYARFSLHQNERWIKIGQHKGWLVTGGSDFHGEIKPTTQLGSSWVNEETFKVLKDHFIRSEREPPVAL
jgi:predicted metal-dependent phosphoesterase TrpH